MIDPLLLLIDDDKDDREIFRDIVQELYPKAVCTTAINGIEALNQLTATNARVPDIIFMDINLPCLNGKLCLQKLKKTALSHVPVVMYTTSCLDSEKDETRLLGAAGFISKPFRSQDLKAALKITIEQILLGKTMANT